MALPPLKRPWRRALRENLAYRCSWVNLYPREIGQLGHPLNGDYLIATKNGLLRLRRDGCLLQLIKGEFYGIAIEQQRVFVFQKLGRDGRILEIDRTLPNGLGKAHVFLNGLSPGCHQLDSLGKTLYVCDTYNNAVLQVDMARALVTARHLPFGPLRDGRKSANYVHLNSIYFTADGPVVLCHNESVKTGRASEIVELCADFTPRRRLTLSARAGHNCILLDGAYLYCDSLGGRLLWGEEVLVEVDTFTRGLSVSDELIVLGGSHFSAKRHERIYGSGTLYVLDRRTRTLVATLDLPGQVQEIRRFDGPDLGLSARQVTHRFAHGTCHSTERQVAITED